MKTPWSYVRIADGIRRVDDVANFTSDSVLLIIITLLLYIAVFQVTKSYYFNFHI